MIIVELSGGLGNQMFQYAFGRQLQVIHGEDVYFDRSFFENQKEGLAAKRQFQLDIFGIDCKEPDPEIIRSSIGGKNLSGLTGFFSKVVSRISSSIIIVQEDSLSFKPEMLQKRSGIKLYRGFWQSELYFSDVAGLLKDTFQMKAQPVVLNGVLKDILSSNSVAVHVRRGDYLNSDLYARLGMSYYISAMSFLKARFSGLRFFIFSDDPAWVKSEFLPFEDVVVASEERSGTAAREMYLMSQCNHFIIANSTFSWWAAWLGKYQDKIVVSPKRWFNSEVRNQEARDIIPLNWNLL